MHIGPHTLFPRQARSVWMTLGVSFLLALASAPAFAQQADSTNLLIHELRQLRLELMEQRLARSQDRIRDAEAEARRLANVMQSLEKRDAAIALETAEMDDRLADVSLDGDARARLQATKADFLVRAPREARSAKAAAEQRGIELTQEVDYQRAHAAKLAESIRELRQQIGQADR